jgi:hypothetical protein
METKKVSTSENNTATEKELFTLLFSHRALHSMVLKRKQAENRLSARACTSQLSDYATALLYPKNIKSVYLFCIPYLQLPIRT